MTIFQQSAAKPSPSPSPYDSRVFDTVTLKNTEAVLAKLFRSARHRPQPKPLLWREIILLAVAAFVPLAALVYVSQSPWARWEWRDPAGHLAVEFFGVLIVLCVSYVTFRGFLDSGSRRLLLLTLAFLAMAVFDVFHALCGIEESSWTWMRALSAATGAVFFAFAAGASGDVRVALSPAERRTSWMRLALFVLALALVGTLFVQQDAGLPAMTPGRGLAYPVMGLHLLSALILLSAVLVFLKDFRYGGGKALFGLSLTLVLLADSSIMTLFAHAMDATWWLGHVVRLLAYLLLLLGVTLGFAHISTHLSRAAWDLKRAEDIAVREQSALRSVFDSIADELVVVDMNFVIQTANVEAVRRHGDAAFPNLGLIGRHCFEVFDRRDTLCPDCPVLETLRTGRAIRGHRRKHWGRDDKEYTADLSAGPLRDAAGLTVGAVLMIRDVTDSQALTDAIRRERDFVDRVIQTADVMIVGLDLNGNITLFNRKCVELTGYAPEEVLGQPLWDHLIPERFIAPVKQVFAKIKADVLPSEFENPWLTRSGEERWIAWHNTNIKDTAGQVTGIIAIGVDITDRMKAEEAARFLSSLIEQSRQALRVTTLEGQIARCNRAFEELTGYTEREIKRMTFRDLSPQRCHQREEEKRAEIIAKGKPLTYESEVVCKDGRVIPVELATDIFRDARGNPEYLYSFVRDITERKRAEEAHRKLQDQILQVQKMTAVGTLAGGIAHEYNNILGAILGYASLLKAKIGADHPFYKPIDTIEKSSRRAAELTRQITSFARAGRYQAEPVDINEIVRRAVSVAVKTPDVKYRVATRLQENSWPVAGDRSELAHALINLCVNAQEAMPNGGHLAIGTENITVTETYAKSHVEAKPGPYVMVSVSDTGVGIPPEMQQRIFEPFFTTKEEEQRVGLGLAVVYGIVKGHSGFITVSSEIGKGTCFRLYLPAAATAAEARPARKPGKPPRGRETILLVEDEEVVRSAAADILEHLGYTVLQAVNGREAVDVYRRHKREIALVLLDVLMPDMGGREVWQAIRKMNPAAKVLIASGYRKDEVVDQMLAEGAALFIQKPFEMEDLAAAVRKALGDA